jgi:hypothetical protein
MIHVLIRHKVTDFDRWKAVYDGRAGARKAAGLDEEHLLRSIADPNEVVLLFTAEDLTRARAFVGSPDSDGAMRVAGVVEGPDIYFLS